MTSSAASRPRVVYFAGPDVFLPEGRAIFERLKSVCTGLGLQGLAPFDGVLDRATDESPEAFAQRIYEGNVARIRACDGVIANLVPFRGLEPDSGTVFEVGFAVALGLPVVGYHVPLETYAVRVQREIACLTDTAGEVREAGSGTIVEGLGQRINLMLSRSVLLEPDADSALQRLAGLLEG